MVDKKAKKENPEKQVKAVKESKDSKKESKKAQAPKEKELKIKTRLADYYKAEIVPSLIKKFSFKSVMQVPRLHKIVVNMGVGEAVTDQKILEEAIKDLETITGQKASMRKSKKAISKFKFRESGNICAMVILRKKKKYEINFDKVTRVLGMDITFVTSAPTDNEAYELLQAFGVPFRKKEIKSA